MSLLHKNSCESVNTGLDLFQLPPTQTAVQDGLWVEYHPLATLAQSAPIEFSISGNTVDYLDFDHTYLNLKAKITKPDGTDIDDGANVAPVNYWMHTLFSQVDVFLNDTLVTPSENTYPYRAYIEATLNYGREAKKSHLTSSMYYRDSANHFDDVQGDANSGLKVRRDQSSRSKVIDMIGRLHCDIFHQERYLINGVDVKIRLIPSKSVFNLMSDTGEFKSVITHASMFVRKVKLNPAVSLAHAKALEKGTVKLPLKRVLTKVFSIATGSLSVVKDNLFLTQTPNRLVIGLVDSSAFNGLATKNPFNFRTYNLNFLSLYLDGKQIPSKPLTPNYLNQQFIRAYYSLVTATGLANKDAGSYIEKRDFPLGYTLYAFDLTPSLQDDNNLFELVRSGALRIEMKFERALQESVVAIVLGEMDSLIEIDKSRQILTDFS